MWHPSPASFPKGFQKFLEGCSLWNCSNAFCSTELSVPPWTLHLTPYASMCVYQHIPLATCRDLGKQKLLCIHRRHKQKRNHQWRKKNNQFKLYFNKIKLIKKIGKKKKKKDHAQEACAKAATCAQALKMGMRCSVFVRAAGCAHCWTNSAETMRQQLKFCYGRSRLCAATKAGFSPIPTHLLETLNAAIHHCLNLPVKLSEEQRLFHVRKGMINSVYWHMRHFW